MLISILVQSIWPLQYKDIICSYNNYVDCVLNFIVHFYFIVQLFFYLFFFCLQSFYFITYYYYYHLLIITFIHIITIHPFIYHFDFDPHHFEMLKRANSCLDLFNLFLFSFLLYMHLIII